MFARLVSSGLWMEIPLGGTCEDGTVPKWGKCLGIGDAPRFGGICKTYGEIP